MTTFSVWAPGKSRVDVDLDGHRVAMSEVDDGWWEVDVPGGSHGTSYRFTVDGGEALPDPRSRWQPDGIDGPSAVVDHDRWEWHDGGWRGRPLVSAVIYEMHIGTFSGAGTFEGAIEHLDHLVDLGITAIELLPVAEFSGRRGWGYDGVLLWAPHHAYGGPEGFKRLVDAAHARGLAVILDVVYNHLGPAGNHLAKFGPYFTDRYRTPWGDAVNYDGQGADGVREFVIGNALMWLRDYHLDGLRLDAVHAIFDEQATHVLEAMAAEVEKLAQRLDRPLWLIAESDLNDPRLVRGHESGGYGLDAAWSDDFHHALHVTLTDERAGYYRDFDGLPSLARALEQVFVFAGDFCPSRQRRHGRPLGGVPANRFLGYLQNHDQIGNRAVGERSAALMSTGRLMIGAALVMTSPFVPMLFQGEEWGASTPWQYFTDHQDPDLATAVADGRRGEFAAFGWKHDDVPNPQDPTTFSRSTLDWAELQDRNHRRILDWHQQLIELRSRLAGQPTAVTFEDHAERRWLCLHRGPVTVVAGLGPATVEVALPAGGEMLLASDPDIRLTGSAVALPPDSVAIIDHGAGRGLI